MKDKTQYHMLRIKYISGTIPEQKFAEDGGEIVPDPDLIGDVFVVCVMNYRPATDMGIYASKEEVTLSLLEKTVLLIFRLESAMPACLLKRQIRQLF